MAFMLGNFSIQEMEERLGVSFPDELVAFMETRHQPAAENVAPGKWHCFDLPFVLVCGDMETAVKINELLSPLSDQCQAKLQISLAR